ncbi:MAG: hypothetical protein RSD35_01630 [Oscillospiraceae bacterium]
MMKYKQCSLLKIIVSMLGFALISSFLANGKKKSPIYTREEVDINEA